MTILISEIQAQAHNVVCTSDELRVDLTDGRSITVPISWFKSLSNATQSQLDNWELLGNGEGIHWPELDEDLSISGLLAGKH